MLGISSSHAVGSTGGSETATLTVEQLPAHSHRENIAMRYTDGGGAVLHVSNGNEVTSFTAVKLKDSSCVGASGSLVTTDSTGSSKSHNNMPPYYTLAYIMKL